MDSDLDIGAYALNKMAALVARYDLLESWQFFGSVRQPGGKAVSSKSLVPGIRLEVSRQEPLNHWNLYECRRVEGFTANLHVQLIGMEACDGSHFLGRALREKEHEVGLIPAQYMKPYVKTNKSDYIDAEAIAEAVGRPTMRFVRSKPTSS